MTVRKQDACRPLLREARLELGWTQQDLARHLDVTTVTINRWERGTTTPSAYYRTRLSDLFHKSPQSLGLTLDEPQPAPQQELDPQDILALLDPLLPPQKPLLIGRDGVFTKLVDQLCTSHSSYAITGLPAVGKTALLAALGHHPRIRKVFKDGILWVRLGWRPQLLSNLLRWGRLLGATLEDTESFVDSDAWATYLHELIGSRRILLLLDDVWRLSDATLFRPGGLNCSAVLTTRFPLLAHTFAPAHTIHLQELNEAEGLALVSRLAPDLTCKFPSEMRDLVKLVGGLPGAVTAMSQYISLQAYGGQLHRARYAIEQLRNSRAERLQLVKPQLPWEGTSDKTSGALVSLQDTIELVDLHLPDVARTLLRKLALFPPKPSPISETDALTACRGDRKALNLLIDCGLLENDQQERYQMHQVIADYALLLNPFARCR